MTLTSTANTDITFNDTLDGNFALIVNTGGGSNFFGVAGGTTPLASVTMDAPGLTRVAANVTTVGGQSWGDQLALFGNVQLKSNGNGAISFAQVDNNFDLITNTGGATTFNSPVGSLVALHSLSSFASAFNGPGPIKTNTTLSFTDTGSTWTITPTSVTLNGGTPVGYNASISGLLITGGANSDTFNVTPSSTTTVNIVGGNPPPPATPGDRLNVDATGATSPALTKTATPSGFQGSYTFGNRQPVNFNTIETISNCISGPLAISCPGGITKFTDSGQTSATINPGTPVTTGGCAPITVTGVRSDGKPLNAPYPVGVTVISWTATDAGNNSTSCSQSIAVMKPSGQRRRP